LAISAEAALAWLPRVLTSSEVEIAFMGRFSHPVGVEREDGLKATQGMDRCGTAPGGKKSGQLR
jgi:hypothetical protein